jgi:inorganic phosphate transporter, PiT family
MAGFANFAGYFFFGLTIAKMVGSGIVVKESISVEIILAALVGAIFWNILTWLLGLPTSSSHALIGSLVGSAMAAAGISSVIVPGVLKIAAFIAIAPLLGMAGAVLFTALINRLFARANYSRSKPVFKRLQLVSAAFYSLSHGTNDAQKTMGIITLVLFSAGAIPAFEIPHWVVFSCYAAIGLGTMFGGWRIVKTLGSNITKIHAKEGFIAETSSGLVLFLTAHFGIPVSTTHVISGSIMGVGAAEGVRSVRWVTARRIVWAWILTIPVTAAVGGGTYLLINLFW